MNIFRLAFFALFLVACSSCAGQTHNMRAMPPKTRVIESGYRLVVDCDSDGKADSYGSMSAVGPRHFLTARHMACGPQDEPTYTALGRDGKKRRAIMENMSGTVDVAVVKLADGEKPNATWAPIAAKDPELGEAVYQFGGGAYLDVWAFKVGYVSQYTDKELLISTHSVPGNSGSGIFNTQGELVGVLWGGMDEADKEFFCLATKVAMFKTLLTGIDS